MQLQTLFYIVYKNFNNRRSRVFFTVLGVAVAIAVVLTLVSFGYGLQRSLLARITTQEALLSLDTLPSDPTIIHFDTETLDAMRALPDVEEVSPQAEFTGQMALGAEFSGANVNAVDASFFKLDGRSPLEGRFFKEGEKDAVVVDSSIAQLFGLTDKDLLGKTLSLTIFAQRSNVVEPNDASTPAQPSSAIQQTLSMQTQYTIVGVTETSANPGVVYIEDTNFPEGSISEYGFAKVKVRDQGSLEPVRDALVNRGFIVSSISDTVTQANKIFGAIQFALGVFGVFALVVAGIGLVNTMTVTLLERTNEIGIMRAVGASPRDIRYIFLSEAVMIGFIGGVFGVLLGVVISEILNALFNVLAGSLGGTHVRLFFYPWWFILSIIGLSALVGFLGGIWPARRAGRMNPLEALRYK